MVSAHDILTASFNEHNVTEPPGRAACCVSLLQGDVCANAKCGEDQRKCKYVSLIVVLMY